MSGIRIKASSISHLTDARYFAAAGTDYLGFACTSGEEGYCSPDKIREIMSWVEGPQFVLEWDGFQDGAEIRALVESLAVHAVHAGPFWQGTDAFAVPVFKDILLEDMGKQSMAGVTFPVIRTDVPFEQLTTGQRELLVDASNAYPVFLDIPFHVSQLEELLAAIPLYGVIVRGGHEEKTGVKSFDAIDELLDKIRG